MPYGVYGDIYSYILNLARWVFHCFCLSLATQQNPSKPEAAKAMGANYSILILPLIFHVDSDQLPRRKPFVVCIKRNAFGYPFLRHDANNLTYYRAASSQVSYSMISCKNCTKE